MDDLDLSGVDPLRWDEVRRRIGVIKDYLAIPLPTDADRKRHAARLDRSVNQFMALVRSWREHGSAARIAASGTHRGAPRSPGRLSVNPVARQVAVDAVEELGARATLAGISRLVGERCVASGVKPPSDSTIWNIVRARRQGLASGETGVVIGTCLVDLPLTTAQGLSRPMLTIAVRASDRAILAASIEKADWTTATLAILAALPKGETVRVDRDLVPPESVAGPEVGVRTLPDYKIRSAISRMLGTGVDDLQLIYRPGKAKSAERLLTTREDRPLSAADARTLIVAGVARHNVARGARAAVWIDGATPSSPASAD